MPLVAAHRGETLENAFAFRFWRRVRRPALHDFEREETEQREAGEFQVEPQIFCDLLNLPNAIELRCELRFGDG